MSEPAHREAHPEATTPAAVAQLLDVVAADRVDHALTEIERVIARLRADAAAAAKARSVLGATPAPVLREALRLRASSVSGIAGYSDRSEAVGSETHRSWYRCPRDLLMSSHGLAGYTTQELQAAAAALTAGRFATGTDNATSTGISTGISTGTPTGVPDRAFCAEAMSVAVPGDRATGHSGTDCPIPSSGSAPVVRIRAAHAGAGASTTALALADVADVAGIRTRVLDAAAPAWSGLLGAAVTELGAAEGWRRGRRGTSVLLDRVAEPVLLPAQVPPPRGADGVALTVLDAGWSMRELAAAPDAWVALMPAHVDVLVTRRHDLALHQTEAALALLADQTRAQACADSVVVVMVGAKRWSAREFPTAGPLLRAVRRRDGVVFAPFLPARALPGLGPDRMPTQLTTCVQRLLDRITTITGPLAANRT